MVGSARRGLEVDLPRRIGRYEVFRQIGAGGMARVYLGLQHGPFAAKKLVVVKQMRPDADEQLLEMFVDEARIALQLNHPNVVHTYEVVAEPPDYYLAMEFLDGQPLSRFLRRVGRENVALEEHVWILTQVLSGLDYAHHLRTFNGEPLPVVHRDVTPSNVVVCYSGEVKLLDFGIAKADGAVSHTREGIMKGKLGYAAPEQCLGMPADPRSDIYAVGVMLWEAMARRPRAIGETWAAKLQARLQNAEPPIESVWPEAPRDLVAITERALHPEPERRYETAQEFQRDLEAYLSRSPRKVGAEIVGAILRAHFQADRAEVQQAIEAHLEEREPPASYTALRASRPVSLSAAKNASSWSSAVPESEGEGDTSPIPVDDALLLATRLDTPIESAELSPPFRPKRRWLRAALAGAFGVAAAVLLFLMIAGDGHKVDAFATFIGKPSSLPVAANAPAPSFPAVTPTKEQVAPASRQVIRFEGDVDPKGPLHPEVDKPRVRRLRVLRAPAPRPAPEEPSASPNERQRERIEPGADLRALSPGRGQRSIDDEDPYAQ